VVFHHKVQKLSSGTGYPGGPGKRAIKWLYVCVYKWPSVLCAFSALTLLVRWQEVHAAYEKMEWWGTGVIICLERGANNLHMVQLMPLPPSHLLL